MRFHVPQFIEVEDKIFGPLTFRQFVYMAGALGLAYVLYRLLPAFLGYPLAVGALGLGAALAFYKVNNRPFVATLEAGFEYVFSSKLYIWKKGPGSTSADASTQSDQSKNSDIPALPKLGENRLKNMAWDLDVKDTTKSVATDD